MTTNTEHPHTHDAGEVEAHDLGLSHDLPKIWGRRRLFGLAGGVGAVGLLAACGSDESATTATRGTGTPPSPPSGAGESSTTVADGEIPEETAGPYPGDGSNGPNVLTESGVVREDITTSFGDASGVAEGVPLTIRLKVYDLAGDQATPLSGAAVYLWHCDRDGAYSLYDGDAVGENYLRGVQAADEDGWLSFTTIFPACYAGRWPHAHFEVYPSLEDATTASNRLRTSQLALPQDVCEQVYATDGYEQSVQNLAGVALDSDMVFADGYSLQMAKVTGSVESGFTATLNVPV